LDRKFHEKITLMRELYFHGKRFSIIKNKAEFFISVFFGGFTLKKYIWMLRSWRLVYMCHYPHDFVSNTLYTKVKKDQLQAVQENDGIKRQDTISQLTQNY
jgi:hypothetical protein